MKKYLIIGDATGIGGWQLYNEARVTYMIEKGYSVFLLYSSWKKDERIKLAGLKNSNVLNIIEFARSPYVYTQSQIESVIEKIMLFISYNSSDELFIESTSMKYSMWGELVAKEVKAIHFSYLLHSHIDSQPTEVQKFFEFKFNQGLLAGMSEITLPELFAGYMDIDKNDTRCIPAHWKSPLTNIDLDVQIEDIISCSRCPKKVIGYFGTLNKPHFLSICDEIDEYTKSNKDTQFIFIAVGSSKTETAEKKLKAMDATSSNCRYINVVETYPVPKRIFELMDVCIGSWGSATVAARGGARTIRLVDDISTVPQGIIGITLRKEPYYKDDSCNESLIQLLDNILYHHAYDEIKYIPPKELLDYHIYHEKEDEIIRPFIPREHCYEYYNTVGIAYNEKNEKYIKLLNKLFGVKNTKTLVQALKMLLR